jgi:hypothetical protein
MTFLSAGLGEPNPAFPSRDFPATALSLLQLKVGLRREFFFGLQDCDTQ